MKLTITIEGGNKKSLKDELLPKGLLEDLLDEAGNEGVQMFSNATPRDTGKTANSWSYTKQSSGDKHELIFENDSTTKNGIPIPILLKNGHGTGTGGYVAPNDFITPVMEQVVSKVSKSIERNL